MPNATLRAGSRGKLVGILQKILNSKGKLAEPLVEDEVFGANTKKAVEYFQRRSGLKADGVVGPDTGAALAQLAGPAAGPLIKFLGESEDGEKKGGPTYNLTLNGKTYALTKAEFDEANKKLAAELKRVVLLPAELRVDTARSLWDSFDSLNKDQYIVSFFISLRGPKLPDEGLIRAAEQALARLKSAVGSGDLAAAKAAMNAGEKPINHACATMTKYQRDVIGRAEFQMEALEWTRDKSFDVLTVLATAEMGGSVGAGMVAGEGSAFLKSAANELGKALAGTSGGGKAVVHNIARDVLLGAGSGGVGAFFKFGKGEKIIEGAAKAIAKKVTGKWAARLGTKAVEEFLENRLKGAMSGALDAAVNKAVKSATEKSTLEDVAKDVGKDAVFGAVLPKFDELVEKKVADKVFEKLLKAKFYDGVEDKVAKKVTGEVLKGFADDGVKKAVEVVFDKAKGDEKEEKLAEDTAAEFTKTPAMKKIEAELEKRLKAAAKKR